MPTANNKREPIKIFASCVQDVFLNFDDESEFFGCELMLLMCGQATTAFLHLLNH